MTDTEIASTAGANDGALVDVLERLRNRFFGKYRGIVTQVDAGTMRIKAKVPAVLADQVSGWARACTPYAGNGFGFAFLPDTGVGVWIEFEGGDASLPIWSGCYWHDGEAPPDATATVMALVTKAKQKILFDVKKGSITIEDQNGNMITIDDSGVTLSRGGQSIAISDASVSVNDGALEVT
jgi:uncharacterized protein involved in type VI secretion and phage assembly